MKQVHIEKLSNANHPFIPLGHNNEEISNMVRTHYLTRIQVMNCTAIKGIIPTFKTRLIQ